MKENNTGIKTTAIKTQPCQNLNDPAGINNIAVNTTNMTLERRNILDPRLISFHSGMDSRHYADERR
jgi:hypothetical protein